MPKIQPFEEYIDEYEAWFEDNPLAYESEIAAIQAQLPDGYGIEIGVGSGRFAGPLGITMGMDPSEKMRKMAQKRGIEVIDGVAEAIPCDNEQFDFVLMVTTLCFLDDIATAFGEVKRVLKAGGACIIAFIDADSPIGRVCQQHKHNNVFYRAATFYSAEQVNEYLKAAGFRNISTTQTLFQPPEEMTCIEPMQAGYGKGSFVVMKAIKPKISASCSDDVSFCA